MEGELPLLTLVPLWLGLVFAIGINSYVVVFGSGLILRWGGVVLGADRLGALAAPPVLGIALIGLLLEWSVGKSRAYGSLWDALHAPIRPLVAAAISALLFADFGWTYRLLLAMVGAGVAFLVHSTKASVRFAAAGAPDGRWLLAVSLGEELTAAALLILAWFRPTETLVTVGIGGLAIGMMLPRVLCALMRAAERTLTQLLSR
ncbi:MAG: hypothetical protein KatS3mg115_0897 [Candidatus Poribacteria bacterium]|nr:MAG: hypothetical protein KatS3mg115_0897 [Candidatus Poribacteria bacterium]